MGEARGLAGEKPKSRDRRVVIRSRRAVLLCIGAACLVGRSEESVRNEFRNYVDGANSCTDASACATAYADCPLGCYVAVRADRKASVEAKADELVAAYERGGARCYYDCAAPTALVCLAGRCAFDSAQPSSGAGGLGGAGGRGVSGPGTGLGGRGGAFVPPPATIASIRVDPLDGRTNTASQPITVTVTDPGLVVDTAALDALLAGLSFMSWPDGTPVPYGLSVTPPAGMAAGQRVIRLTPRASFEDRWYALLLGNLPQALSYYPPVPIPVTGVRFHPLSAPRVLLIEVCDTEARLNVVFSEPIVATAAAAELVTVVAGAAPLACTLVRQDDTSVDLMCPGLGPTSRATVSIAGGLMSQTGLAVPAASFDVDVATLPQAALCRWLVAPIP